jgi:CRP/FNR family transcriptional regulator, cyclic AMP receptor protein
MADAADLAGVPLFDSLTEGERAEVAPWFELKNVSPGVNLASEGASGYSFYVLLDGSAEVNADGRTVATYGPGDFFGEMALIDADRRSATVTTTSPATVLALFGTEFWRLHRAHPAVVAEVERVAQERRRQLDDLASGTDAGS